MGKVVLIRHGQTDWNTVDRIQGWQDVPLSEEGIKQALHTARRLSSLDISAVYSSPLSRALGTAERIAGEHGLKVVTVENFKELNQGEWEGMLVSEAKAKFPRAYENWLKKPVEHGPPGGETAAQVRDRVMRSYFSILSGHSPDQTICIVAHKVVIAVIKCVRNDLDLNGIHSLLPDNTGMEIIHEDFNNSLQLPPLRGRG